MLVWCTTTATPPPGRRRGGFALVARAPDPNGGLPYGLETVPSIVPGAAARGETCLFGGGVRVVGDRAGAVDYRRDVLKELEVNGGGGCGSARRSSRRCAG